ncbi:glycosyltransferase 87 family protein [Geodermatophilus sp. YIM 151500]|uniref:glycosyltransferase family 87 protein n=1 Tax=Geodermatophilus sp. YIM 151500 TaxID=2984531 RepID=UPI0021E44E73|nr:glycosyltransferase 87 family protein [Geodermatophilus sp. YIM 151500]MCV2491867.1 glycosyltransferase 87 family protein [Geodermatophilus sp. YIM 151500]
MPSWVDPVVRQASEAVGGPWGRHAATGRALFWTPLRVCLMFTSVVLALAWLKQAPCAAGDWSGSRQYTHFCYSDAVPLFGLYGLDQGALPYLDVRVEYPVLTGGLMAVAVALSRAYDGAAEAIGVLPDLPAVQSYTAVTCLLLSVCALLVTRATLGLTGRRPWDTALVALSPLLFVHAFTNWDLLAVALTTFGMLAWARSRPVVAGALFGLAIAAKFYPLLLLGVLFALCLRAGRLRQWAVTVGTATLAWAAVNVPVALAAPEEWAWFFVFSRERRANPESIWNMLLQASGGQLFDGPLAEGEVPSVLNTVVAVVMLALAAGVAGLALAAPLRPRLPQLAFLLLAGFLLFNKVWSPQFSLWLLPLAVLARPRWRSLLLWQATEVLVWMLTMLHYLGTANRGVEVEWFFLAVGLRDVALVVLMALVVRDVLRPDDDVVRASWPGVDDPAGGPLDGARDVVALRRSAPHRDPVPSPG